MERLKDCDERAFKELLVISEDKLYTVSRLLESIPQWGGTFYGVGISTAFIIPHKK